ncbi:MAG: DUF502 domain-containing protein [Gammaproteobacteria bacterium]|nr:DUF502 domain-containing protein [Gammaproteobacteria bacterium]
MTTNTNQPRFSLHIQRYLLTGVLTIVPLWITWVVFDFVLRQLARFGQPWVTALLGNIQNNADPILTWLLAPWFQTVLAILITLLALYLLGWATSRVAGRRILTFLEHLISRIPGIQSIYGSVKKLISVLQQKPENVQRVVLIGFPSKELKTIGFVTRLITDEQTGRQLAAVYVPTTPNPTSGYMEIVPLDSLVSTDLTMEEAMSFILSGGAIAPETLPYYSAEPKPE